VAHPNCIDCFLNEICSNLIKPGGKSCHRHRRLAEEKLKSTNKTQAEICLCESRGKINGGELWFVRRNCPMHGGRKLSAMR